MTSTASGHARGTTASEVGQLSFDGLDSSLRETTFVVLDLETTGTNSASDAITEIGAVKVRGGALLGEFATLVNPDADIPPYIVQITGITTAMISAAPRIEEVIPALLEFLRGAVLVAHNAPFDVGFLKAAFHRHGYTWPAPSVLCTVTLARRVLSREEAPSVKLSALAELLHVRTKPTHRALDDARATVEVLHALIERVGNLGVHSLTELNEYFPRATRTQRAKRELGQHLPQAPGVYLFRGPGEEVLYIGTSTNLRRRVRSYFTGSDTRGRIQEMVNLATRVDHVECAHALEAGVRELRLIAAHNPPYNRRSTWPRRAWWITLTEEPFPRLTLQRAPSTTSVLGPFRGRGDAAAVASTIAEQCGLRTCTKRLGHNRTHGDDCPHGELGGCPAARRGVEDSARYAAAADTARALLDGRSDTALETLVRRVGDLAATERFESAALLRDRAASLGLALHRSHRMRALCAIDELIGAHPRPEGGWDLAVVRSGRLAAAGIALRGVPPMPVVEALAAAAETVLAEAGPLRGALPEEVRLVERWLTDGTTRIVRASDGYHEPAHGAGRFAQWCQRATSSTAVSAQYLR